MGTFEVKVKVVGPTSPERSFQESFWVEPGALYCSVPQDRLDPLGIPALGHRKFLLADGVFAPPGSPCLLGAMALEAFGLEVDPVDRKLKPRTLNLFASLAG